MSYLSEPSYDSGESYIMTTRPAMTWNERPNVEREEEMNDNDVDDINTDDTEYYALAEPADLSDLGPRLSSVLDLERSNTMGEVDYYNGEVVELSEAGPFYYEKVQQAEGSNTIGTVASNSLDPNDTDINDEGFSESEDTGAPEAVYYESVQQEDPNIEDNGNTAGEMVYYENVQPYYPEEVGTVSANELQPESSTVAEPVYYSGEEPNNANTAGEMVYYENVQPYYPEEVGTISTNTIQPEFSSFPEPIYYSGEEPNNANTAGEILYYEDALPEASLGNYGAGDEVLEYYDEDEDDEDDEDDEGIETCPDGSECFNGSKCLLLKQGDKMVFECDCTTIGGPIPFAGNGCRIPATSFCSYYGPNKESFCTNHGACKKISMPNEYGYVRHLGCDCSDEFRGPFCEFKKQPRKQVQSNKVPDVNQGHFALVFSLTMLFALTVLSAIVVFNRKYHQEQSYEEVKVNDSNVRDHTLEFEDSQVGEVDKSKPIV